MQEHLIGKLLPASYCFSQIQRDGEGIKLQW